MRNVAIVKQKLAQRVPYMFKTSVAEKLPLSLIYYVMSLLINIKHCVQYIAALKETPDILTGALETNRNDSPSHNQMLNNFLPKSNFQTTGMIFGNYYPSSLN